MPLRQISLQDSVVYGPVRSRRFGHSLGINPLPTNHKVCSSNCVYCQYGWTRPGPSPERIRRGPELLGLIEEAFQDLIDHGTPVDCITLAGNGEPTLHPDLEELITGILRLRDRYFPAIKVGILSDGTQAHRPSVQRALRQLDVRYMKLDGGDEAMWRTITAPFGNVSWPTYVAALKNLPDIILQSMFVQGRYDNTQQDHIDRWVELVASIRPLSVQIYTIDRVPADRGVAKVPRDRLEAIASTLARRTGIPADVYE